jgi:hypothetical protein
VSRICQAQPSSACLAADLKIAAHMTMSVSKHCQCGSRPFLSVKPIVQQSVQNVKSTVVQGHPIQGEAWTHLYSACTKLTYAIEVRRQPFTRSTKPTCGTGSVHINQGLQQVGA